MRWQGGRRSGNILDLRGRSPLAIGGGLGGAGLLVLVVIMLLTGTNPQQLLQGTGPAPDQGTPGAAPTDPAADFVSVVLADTEDTWSRIFLTWGAEYPPPQLVLYREAVSSGCGNASSAVGPFYCPADRRVYLDLTFFDELASRFGAPGDLAQAYVVAHEVGHHVQTLQGLRTSRDNQASVRMELQADCYAGVWAHHARRRDLLERGDVEEALGAAAAVGDDRLQRQTQGTVRPDTFTHGTSAQRTAWFRRGLELGQPGACDPGGARASLE